MGETGFAVGFVRGAAGLKKEQQQTKRYLPVSLYLSLYGVVNAEFGLMVVTIRGMVRFGLTASQHGSIV